MNGVRLWAVSDVVIPINSLYKLETLTLDVGSIGAYILRGLCRHPTVRKLVLDLCDVEETFLTHLLAHRANASEEFPKLEEMILLADISIVDMTLSALVRAPLLRLAISTFTLAHTDALAHCFLHIANNSPHLQSLTLITSLLDSTLHQPLKLVHLSPLAALRDLAVLSIELGFPIQLDDAEIITFVQRLAHLTTLVLSPAPEWAPEGWRPKATMRSLEWISRHAKRITNLGLAFDLSIEPVAVAQPPLETVDNADAWTPPYYDNSIQHQLDVDYDASVQKLVHQPVESQLETLFVGASYPRLGKSKEVGAHFLALFPLLQTVRHSNAPRKYSGAGLVWSDVVVENEWARVAEACRRVPSNESGCVVEQGMECWNEMEMMESGGGAAGVEADEYEWRLAEGIAA